MAVSLIGSTGNLKGESTDAKPTTNIEVNTLFVELDTGDVYYYDGTDWLKVGGE